MNKIQLQYVPKEVRKRKDFDVRAGDTVRVNVKIQEKGKTRIQTFEGLVLARKHGKENGATITVRKVSHGVGVERIFPIYSPMIESIEVTRRAKVRRSKLYFLRNMVSKLMRYKLRRISDMKYSSADLPDWDTEEDVVPEGAELMEEEVESKEGEKEQEGGESPEEKEEEQEQGGEGEMKEEA